MRNARTIFTLTICLLATHSLRAENWPQWRGARWDSISHEKNIPATWSTIKNVAWRLQLPGQAGATPVIWNDRIFLTSADREDPDSLMLVCVSTSGKELWRREMGSGNRRVQNHEGNMASPSPATDGKHVWAFMGTGELACFAIDGREVWRFNMQDRYGEFKIAFGMTSTPLLDGDRLYFQLIHGDRNAETREAVVVCLDKQTGREIWKQDRPSDGYAENEHSYASPTIYRDKQQEFLITHGADYVVAHDMDTGKEIWRSGGLNVKSKYDPTLRFVASPAAVPGLIVVPTAKAGPVRAILPGGKGDITDSKYWTWSLSRTPDVCTPLIHSGLVYFCMKDGSLMCVDAKTGKLNYFERKNKHRFQHRASPVYADGKIYLSARDGVVSVIKAGRKFELLARNDVGEDLGASPAISNGTIYLRTYEALWAIRASK